MGGVHATADVPEDTQTALGTDSGIPGQLSAQTVAGKVLHRNGVRFVDAQEVMNANNVLMSHASGIAQFADEPFDHPGIR